MKRFILLFLMVPISYVLFSQRYRQTSMGMYLAPLEKWDQMVKIINSSTNEPVKASDNVLARVNYSYFDILYDYYTYNFFTVKGKEYQNVFRIIDKIENKDYNISNGWFLIDLYNLTSINIKIESANFETYTFYSNKINVNPKTQEFYTPDLSDCHDIFKDNLNNWIFDNFNMLYYNYINIPDNIYLVPKKTIVEGNINVKSIDETNKTELLGLLSTKTIAEGLNITEDEIIKLILTNQLKGKKIGDRYFVRKEDFDLFMKK